MEAPVLAIPVRPAVARPQIPTRPTRALAVPKVLLCDLDGTLIDTMPILADLATDVLEEMYGMPRDLARDMYLGTSGLPFIRQLDVICPDDARNPVASDRFERQKPARCAVAAMRGSTVRALGALQAGGTRIVVSSNNGVENVAAFAAASGFPFDLLLGYDGRGLSKGAPHIERAAATFGVDRTQMLFVGDSLHDGEIAEKENLTFVGIAGTFSKERFSLRFPGLPVVDRVADLLDLFAASAA